MSIYSIVLYNIHIRSKSKRLRSSHLLLTGYVTQKAKLFESGEIDENQERDRRKMQEDLAALKEKYCYLYETHMHTKEGSACGRDNAADIVRAYKEAGYAGVIVTDHFFGGNTAIDRSLP